MKTYISIFVAILLSSSAFGQQFRLVGNPSGFPSQVNDSTYTLSVDFASDQTGNGFLPTQIPGDGTYRIFFQNEKVYLITGITNATFSSADLTLVEYGTTDGQPSGQSLVYDPENREIIPQAPANSSGASPILNSAIFTYNLQFTGSVVNTDIAVFDTTFITTGNDLNADFFNKKFNEFKEIVVDATLSVSPTSDFIINLPVAENWPNKIITLNTLNFSSDNEVQVFGIYNESPLYMAESTQTLKLESRLVEGNYKWVLTNPLSEITEVFRFIKVQDISVDSNFILDSLTNRSNILIKIELSDTITQEKKITLPNISSLDYSQISFLLESETNDNVEVYLEPVSYNQLVTPSGKAKRYYLSNNELVTLSVSDSSYVVNNSGYENIKRISSNEDFYNQRFFRGQIIELREARYRVGDNFNNWLVDSVLVKPIQDKAPSLPNLLSEISLGLGDSLLISTLRNIGPSNFDVLRVTSKTGNPVNNFSGENRLGFLWNGTESNQIGDKFILSFYYKVGNSSNNVSLQIDVNPSRIVEGDIDVNVNSSNKDWIFFSQVFTLANSGVAPSLNRPNLRFDIGANDTVFISNIEIYETANIQNGYRLPDTQSDQLYATLITNDNELTFEHLDFQNRYETEAEEIQASLDLVAATDQINILRINETTTLEKPIVIPELISLRGGDGLSASVIMRIDIDDPNIDAITFEEPGGIETSGYHESQVLGGFDFLVRSPCRAVIEIGCGIDNLVEHVSIKGVGVNDNSNNITWADSLHQYGISSGNGCGPAGLDNTLNDIDVEDAWDYGFYLAFTKLIIARDLRTMRNNKGLYHSGADLFLTSAWVENIHNTGIVLRGEQATLLDTYFESIGELQLAEPQDDERYLVDSDGLESLHINDVVVTGISDLSLTQMFKLRNTNTTKFSVYRGADNSNLTPPVLNADNTNGAVFFDTWDYTKGIGDTSLVKGLVVNGVSILDIEDNAYYSQLYRFITKEFSANDGLLYDNFIANNIAHDTFHIDQFLSVKAYGQNLIKFSELQSSVWNDLSQLTLSRQDTVINNLEFSKLKYGTSCDTLNDCRLRYSDTEEVLKLNNNYLLSFYTYSKNTFPSDTFTLQINNALGRNSDLFTIPIDIPSGTKRHFIPFRYDDESVTSERIHFSFTDNNISENDSLWVSGFQIQKIKGAVARNFDSFKLSYNKTNGSKITDPNVFSWSLEDEWNIVGDTVNIDLLKVENPHGNENTLKATIQSLSKNNGVNGQVTLKGENAIDNAGNETTRLFAVENITTASEVERITTTGADNLLVIFEVQINGYTAGQGTGFRIDKYSWTGTGTPTLISSDTDGVNTPALTFDTATANQLGINLASSDAIGAFKGNVKVIWNLPQDNSNNTFTFN